MPPMPPLPVNNTGVRCVQSVVHVQNNGRYARQCSCATAVRVILPGHNRFRLSGRSSDSSHPPRLPGLGRPVAKSAANLISQREGHTAAVLFRIRTGFPFDRRRRIVSRSEPRRRKGTKKQRGNSGLRLFFFFPAAARHETGFRSPHAAPVFRTGGAAAYAGLHPCRAAETRLCGTAAGGSVGRKLPDEAKKPSF